METNTGYALSGGYDDLPEIITNEPQKRTIRNTESLADMDLNEIHRQYNEIIDKLAAQELFIYMLVAGANIAKAEAEREENANQTQS